MEAYTILAKYYDILMQDFNYQSYLDFIKKYTKGEGIDLCCGTGTMTILLSKLGNKMLGVDISNDMLNIARNKAKENFQNIIFINDDIFEFTPLHKVDFITCVCDGINYVDYKKLKTLFLNIANSIKKDGYFIFDISSEYKHKNILANNVFCEDLDDISYIWSNELKKDKIKMQLSFFERYKDDLFKRYEEEHTQYILNNESLIDMLSLYFDVDTYDGVNYTKLKKDSSRNLYICKRK